MNYIRQKNYTWFVSGIFAALMAIELSILFALPVTNQSVGILVLITLIIWIMMIYKTYVEGEE